jgi:DNA helicase-2/ATP-dependent DNA helicase PcrA
MEEVESRDLQKWARALEKVATHKRAHALMNFASKCMTGVGTDFGSMIKTLESGKSPKVPTTGRKRALVQSVQTVLEDNDLMRLVPVMTRSGDERCRASSTGNMYRHELWNEMVQAIKVYSTETEHASLAEAAWVVRVRGRHTGRRVSPKVISRTLLVKGLEFDHSVILNASERGTKDLYVGHDSRSIQSHRAVRRPAGVTEAPPARRPLSGTCVALDGIRHTYKAATTAQHRA